MCRYRSLRVACAYLCVLQHDLLAESVGLVPRIIEIIRAKDPAYQFVTVERCIWGRSFRSHPSWAFMHRNCDKSVAGASVPPSLRSLPPTATNSFRGRDVCCTGWPSPSSSVPCPVSEWSAWSPCDSNCGDGTMTRVRLTLPPGLEATVPRCGPLRFIESAPCTASQPCDADCTMTPWTAWSACSKTCGGGTRIRTRARRSYDPPLCGPLIQTDICNAQRCV